MSLFVLDGEGTDEEERNMRFSFSTPKEIARGLKRIFLSSSSVPSPSITKRLTMKTQGVKYVSIVAII